MPVPEDAAAYTILREQIEEVLSTLTEREQQVLRLRFGLDDGHQRTLEEVGKIFHVTRERIRQIEAKAIRRIKQTSRARKLAPAAAWRMWGPTTHTYRFISCRMG